MSTKKSLIMAMTVFFFLMSIRTDVQAGPLSLFAKKLDNPKQFDSQWVDDDFCVTWEKVANAGGYKVTYNNKTQVVTEPSFLFQPTKMTGEIYVQTLPPKNSKKYKASDGTGYSFSAKVLSAPKEYSYYQDGKIFVYSIWGDSYNEKYEITTKNGGVLKDITNHSFEYTPNEDEIELGFIDNYVIARKTSYFDEKNVKASPGVTIPLQANIWDYKWINSPFDAALLSKNDLEIWISKTYGCTPTITTKNGYSIVTFSLKDPNNGWSSKLFDLLDVAAAGALESVLDNAGEIADYTLEGDTGKEMKDRAKDATKGTAIVGAVDGILDNSKSIFSNTDVHFTYYYNDGELNRSAKYMTYDYVSKNNKEPDFSTLYYDENDQCYKTANTQFNRIISYTGKKKSSNGQTRWFIYAQPGLFYEVYELK